MTWNRDYLPAIGLGITQIMGYGVLYYAYAILLPKMAEPLGDRKSTRLNSSHRSTSYAVFCLKKKKKVTVIKSL